MDNEEYWIKYYKERYSRTEEEYEEMAFNMIWSGTFYG